ncbi:thioredoxin domain-containing protein [Microlunatus sp. Y2014]|uniref:thioredoxin domain-containing protein n=1 Tax=Microlunatus sp. Y2014 TaxID=3418488 RepID=UPI003DA73430
MANRLADATSPYLLQHADNPVDWQEWGPEALDEAVRRDVPIFLSIGYAACHWCHVMADESFADEQVAAMINSNFVAIKVDREERPDLDAVYMAATVGLTGQGGWPMSVWLTPDGKPFHAGTYFPPEPRHGMPSFPQVLEAVAGAWRDRAADVRSGAADIAAELAKRAAVPPPGEVGVDEIDMAVITLAGDFDDRFGGFGGAPKFPPSMVLDALLARAAQGDGAVADQAWTMARDTCLAMADGGLFDQLAGGFARYSTDVAWVVPHFEKMLYDNALLLGVYGHAAREANRRGEDATRFAEVVELTVGWLADELTTTQGAFASSLDADSAADHDSAEHEEGAYYVWTPAELDAVLGPELGAVAKRAHRVTDAGTFEGGTSVLQRDPEVELPTDVRPALLEARTARPRPSRDDKVVAGWNGWAVAAVAEVAMIFDRPDWLTMATTAATTVLDLHLDEPTGRLARSSRDGVVSRAAGVAEDYAGLAHGCAVLACATGDGAWLDRSVGLLDSLQERFGADDGGLYDTASDAEELFLRPREVAENAIPSATTAALRAERLVHRLTGDDRWRERADSRLTTVGALVARAPRAAGWALYDAVTALGARPAAEVAIVPGADGGDTATLVSVAWRQAPAGSVVVAGPGDGPEGAPGIPVLRGRTATGDRATAYVCRDQVCHQPVTTESDLAGQLAAPVR